MYTSLQRHPGRVFGNLERLRRELDDAFSLSASLPTIVRAAGPATFPAINVAHSPASIEVLAFAPGIDPQQVEVTIERGVLTLAGERATTVATPPSGADDKVVVHSRERSNGRFQRAISLPDDADPERVTAAYRDGVLRITIARREAVQAKRITIQ